MPRLLAALLAQALPLQANGTAQVLPAGQFKARDGRPGPGKFWSLTDAQGRALAASLGAIAAQTPISIDYEHQTLLAATNGQPAPSAGHMLSFDWRAGEGLFAAVDWTARAKAHIDAKEYRWLSPVIVYDDAGTVTGVHNAALVSTPGLLGMDPVQAALSALLPSAADPHHRQPPEPSMTLLATLLAALALPATTAEADALAAVTALRAQAATPPVPTALATALGLAAGVAEPAAVSALAALRATHAAQVTALQGQVTELGARVAQLTAEATDREVVALVDAAVTARKITPAVRDTYLDMGRKDRAMLGAVLAAMVPRADLQGDQTGGKPPAGAGGGTAALTAAQADVAKRMGLDPAKYLAHLQALAAADATGAARA